MERTSEASFLEYKYKNGKIGFKNGGWDFFGFHILN